MRLKIKNIENNLKAPQLLLSRKNLFKKLLTLKTKKHDFY